VDRTSTDERGDANRVEKPANLDRTSGVRPPALVRGAIHRLKHLSAGTDIPTTHLVAAHNGVGYGYIRTPQGDVFFDASAITNVRFDQLRPNMTVDFDLDQASYLKTSHVTVVTNKPVPGK
jgi:cold shock CspA family protein